MLIKKSNVALAIGMICAGFSANSFAAALDRSGQSIAPFLQKGNYAEVGISSLHPTVEGKDTSGNATGDMASSYNFWNAAIKIQPTEMLSFGLIFDEPFGAAATYKGASNFVADGSAGFRGNTDVDVKSRNLSAILGIKPVKGLTLYGGGVYQEVEGDVGLRGNVYSAFNGYTASIEKEGAWGWLAGAAYEIPDIALKASVTYRSEIEHTAKTHESFKVAQLLAATTAGLGQANAGLNTINAGLAQIAAGLNQVNAGLAAMESLPDTDPAKAALLAQRTQLLTQQSTVTAQKNQVQATADRLKASQALLGGLNASVAAAADTTTTITTPQSVNVDFQTGIMADTVAFANVRWVEWSKFSIRPTNFGKASEIVGPFVTPNPRPDGFNIVDYSKDQWTANLGVGRKLTDTIGGTVSVGWDSGAGNPVTTLGPTDGYWNVGLGLRYSPTPQVDLSGGIKYFWLGDAKAQTGAYTDAGNFTGNDAIAVGMKLGYHF